MALVRLAAVTSILTAFVLTFDTAHADPAGRLAELLTRDNVSSDGRLSDRYREEIDPRHYSKSRETTTFCSGVKITRPLNSHRLTFYLQPESADGFIDLLDDHAAQCDNGHSG